MSINTKKFIINMKTLSSIRVFLLFLLMAGLYAVSFFQRVAVPGTIFNDIQQAFAVSAGAVTMLSSIYLFVYAGQQFFIGMLTDKFGGIKVAICGAVLLFSGGVLFPMSKSLTMLYMSRCLVGLGSGAMYLSGIKEIDKLSKPANFAPLVGIFCVIGYGGGLLGTKPFRALVDVYGWRLALTQVAWLSGFFLLMFFLLGFNFCRKQQTRQSHSIFVGVKQVLSNGLTYPLLISSMINFSIYFNIQSTIGTKFISDFLKLPPKSATQYTFVMMSFTIFTMLVSGPLSRFFGNKRKPFIVFASHNIFFAVLLMLCGTYLRFPPVCFMLAFAMLAVSGGLAPVIVSFVKELNHQDNNGLAVGAQNTATYIAVAISAGITGLILNIFKKDIMISPSGGKIYPETAYLTIFIVMLCFSIISIVSSLKTKEINVKYI